MSTAHDALKRAELQPGAATMFCGNCGNRLPLQQFVRCDQCDSEIELVQRVE